MRRPRERPVVTDADATDVYDELGVPTVLNAAGTKTRIGGSRIRESALGAMCEAADSFVRLADLQAAASDRIADVTGAEAGYVTNGASGALLVGTAACIAGDDRAAMAQLPDTTGLADEVVMARIHRTGYDAAIRGAGARIVDVGTNDPHLGTGAREVEPWELRAAIGEGTAAVAYVAKSYSEPPLAEVVEVAHDAGVPVLVDAAAEVPPVDGFTRFVDAGADLVAFSGGKGIRGPQTTGLLAGRADLIRSVAAQHLDAHAAAPVWDPPAALFGDDWTDGGVPRQGIGRPLKVGKEELVGLLAALDAFLEEDQAAVRAAWRERAERVADRLGAIAGVSTHVTAAGGKSVAPEAVVELDATAATDAVGLTRALRAEDPRVFLGADDATDGRVTVNPMCLTDAEAEAVTERVEAHLT
jgi:L-seryl-tRNA(Ser) seleniumtransferase